LTREGLTREIAARAGVTDESFAQIEAPTGVS
jgi:hypothetical protein